MVNFPLLLRSYGVPLLLNGVVNFLIVGWIYVNKIQPLVSETEDIIYRANEVIKTGMSAMGTKSGQVRLDQSVEKAVAHDVLNAKIPEAEFFLSLISADTRELIEDNPEAILRLAQKYGFLDGAQAKPKIEYDL